MVRQYYETVTEALRSLQRRGYTIDFSSLQTLPAAVEEFEITEVHRYEGNSDPGDEAVVYALEHPSGKKGFLVSGFGMSSGNIAPKLLDRLHFQQDT